MGHAVGTVQSHGLRIRYETVGVGPAVILHHGGGFRLESWNLAGRVGGDAAMMHSAGAVLDEHQDVQPFQQHRVDVQEVHREYRGGTLPLFADGRKLLHDWFPRCQDADIDGADHMLPIDYPDAAASAIASFPAHLQPEVTAAA
jgi:pimeloyl-ACP methyl ester carboxylesterase